MFSFKRKQKSNTANKTAIKDAVIYISPPNAHEAYNQLILVQIERDRGRRGKKELDEAETAIRKYLLAGGLDPDNEPKYIKKAYLKTLEKKEEPEIDHTHCYTTVDNISIAIRQTEFRQCYDSVWKIDVEGNIPEKQISCTITRGDSESAQGLECLLRKMGKDITRDAIKKLDEHDYIWYD